jgi:hypothetical protein
MCHTNRLSTARQLVHWRSYIFSLPQHRCAEQSVARVSQSLLGDYPRLTLSSLAYLYLSVLSCPVWFGLSPPDFGRSYLATSSLAHLYLDLPEFVQTLLRLVDLSRLVVIRPCPTFSLSDSASPCS